MKWEIVYEIPEHPFPELAFGTGILCCMTVLYLIQGIKENRNDKRKLYKEILTYGAALLVLVSFTLFSIGHSTDDYVSKEYYNGNYVVYEGEIENYEKLKSTIIHFEIDGELFVWSRAIGVNKVPKEGYVRVYVADQEIARIDKRIQ